MMKMILKAVTDYPPKCSLFAHSANEKCILMKLGFNQKQNVHDHEIMGRMKTHKPAQLFCIEERSKYRYFCAVSLLFETF